MRSSSAAASIRAVDKVLTTAKSALSPYIPD